MKLVLIAGERVGTFKVETDGRVVITFDENAAEFRKLFLEGTANYIDIEGFIG